MAIGSQFSERVEQPHLAPPWESLLDPKLKTYVEIKYSEHFL
jgi:hypothetical protein